MNASTISKLLQFQQTGVGFDPLWADIESHVDRETRTRLRQHFVRGWKTFDDLAAVDEVSQRVRIRILVGAGPGGNAQFNPALGQRGIEGLKGWLFRIVQRETVNYCRDYRAGSRRKLEIRTFTELELNDQPTGDSVFKSPLEVDLDRFETLELLNDCLRSLPQPLQAVYDLRFVEGLPQRKAAKRLGVSAATVSRREERLREAVRDWFGDRGIDGAVLLI